MSGEAENVRRVADWARAVAPNGTLHRDACLAAADRIEALEAERDELMAIIDQMARLRGLAPGEIVAVPTDLPDPENWDVEVRMVGVDTGWVNASRLVANAGIKPVIRRVCRPTPARPTEETNDA